MRSSARLQKSERAKITACHNLQHTHASCQPRISGCKHAFNPVSSGSIVRGSIKRLQGMSTQDPYGGFLHDTLLSLCVSYPVPSTTPDLGRCLRVTHSPGWFVGPAATAACRLSCNQASVLCLLPTCHSARPCIGSCHPVLRDPRLRRRGLPRATLVELWVDTAFLANRPIKGLQDSQARPYA